MFDCKPVLSKTRDLFLLLGHDGPASGHVVSAVYVAYLDPDDNLINAYPIDLIGADLDAVIANDARAQPLFCQVLAGIPAELLHIAVTGRTLRGGPQNADPCLALLAREVLADNTHLPDCAAAYAATVQFGDFIKPWYGVMALDECGRLVLDDVRYNETIDLPLLLA